MKLASALTATATLLVASACSNGTSDSDKPQVLTGLYPLQFVAERVAGPDADVTNLTAPGAEPHDVELTGRQVADIGDADLVVYVSGLQPAIDDVLAQSEDTASIDALEHADAIESDHDDEDSHEEDEHAHEEDEHAHEEEHDHDHEGGDPHVWLDPANLEHTAEAIADALATADPDNADAYRDRADALIAELDELDQQFTDGLKTCERRTIVTAHEAFGYLARAYDLEQVPIAGIDPSLEPSPADLTRIGSTVKATGVTTIFTERLVSPAIAETVARETGATTAVLDPIEGLTDETAAEDYVSLMRKNLASIRKANNCS